MDRNPYSPGARTLQRGHIALEVRIFGSHALAEHESARQVAALDLVGSSEMRAHAGAFTSTVPAMRNPSSTQPDRS